MQTNGSIPPGIGGEPVGDLTTALGGGSLAVMAWFMVKVLQFLKDTRESDFNARVEDRKVLAQVTAALDRNTEVLKANTETMQHMHDYLVQQRVHVPRGL